MACTTPTVTITINTDIPIPPPPTCSGTGIKVNADNTLCVNGQVIFPVGMWGVFFASLGSFPPQPEKTKDFLFRLMSVAYNWYVGVDQSGYKSIVNSFAANGQFLSPLGNQANTLTAADRANPGMFGYTLPDEPDGGQLSPSGVKALHDAVKAIDPNHPTLLNVTLRYNGQSALLAYKDSADILMWDQYTVSNDPSAIDIGANWTRADSPYAYEYRCERGVFLNTTIEAIGKPVWATVQAYGGNWEGIFDVMTQPEIRTMTYLPITMNVKGIVYFTYQTSYGNPDTGLMGNQTELDYYSAQARELKAINNILVKPTIGYSWYGKPDTNTVIISGSNLTKNFTYSTSVSMTVNKLSYVLKGDTSGTYLIIVNKDGTALNNITIRVPSLSTRSGTISLVLNEIAVGGTAGRTLTMTNGQFTDNFAAKAVHVYKLT